MAAKVCNYPSSKGFMNGRYQPESASAKTHTTAGLMTSGSHSAASRGNAAAVCGELSNGKQALPTNRATGGVSSACKFSTNNASNDMSECSRDRLGQWPVESDSEVAGGVSGFGRLHNGRFNKGLAFTIEERQALGLHGLLPATVRSEEEQVQHCLTLLNRYENDLDKYIYLVGLLDRNERLFYRVLSSDIGNMMPLVYTPTVGLACQKYSMIYQQPKGMYITINDKGHVYDVPKPCRGRAFRQEYPYRWHPGLPDPGYAHHRSRSWRARPFRASSSAHRKLLRIRYKLLGVCVPQSSIFKVQEENIDTAI